jgi:hypothetical protein
LGDAGLDWDLVAGFATAHGVCLLLKTQTPARTGTLAFGFEKRVSLLGRAGTWSFEIG